MKMDINDLKFAMKKRFINDWDTFCYLIFCILGFLAILIIMSLSELKNGQYLAYYIFGGFELITLVAFIFTFDIIIISDDKITRWKIFKRKTILYSEIQSIKEMNKAGGATGGYDVWEIRSFDDEIIDFLRGDKRKKFVETIQNKIQENSINHTPVSNDESKKVFEEKDTNKRFINNYELFVIFASISFLAFIPVVLCAISDVQVLVSFGCFLFGVLDLGLFVSLIFVLDIVTISNDQIIQWNIYKRVKIPYCEIESIQETYKKFDPVGGHYVWIIRSSSGNIITVIKTKRRKKYIEMLKTKFKDQSIKKN